MESEKIRNLVFAALVIGGGGYSAYLYNNPEARPDFGSSGSVEGSSIPVPPRDGARTEAPSATPAPKASKNPPSRSAGVRVQGDYTEPTGQGGGNSGEEVTELRPVNVFLKLNGYQIPAVQIGYNHQVDENGNSSTLVTYEMDNDYRNNGIKRGSTVEIKGMGYKVVKVFNYTDTNGARLTRLQVKQ